MPYQDRLKALFHAAVTFARRIGWFFVLLFGVGLFAGTLSAGAHALGLQASTTKLLRMLLLVGYAGVALFFVGRNAR